MYVTLKRPKTEPYKIWTARRRIQKKELKRYLAGRFIHVATVAINEGTYWKPKWKVVTTGGTYRKKKEESIGSND